MTKLGGYGDPTVVRSLERGFTPQSLTLRWVIDPGEVLPTPPRADGGPDGQTLVSPRHTPSGLESGRDFGVG